MTAKMTPRERIRTALMGQMPDQIPFNCYEFILPQGDAAVAGALRRW